MITGLSLLLLLEMDSIVFCKVCVRNGGVSYRLRLTVIVDKEFEIDFYFSIK